MFKLVTVVQRVSILSEVYTRKRGRLQQVPITPELRMHCIVGGRTRNKARGALTCDDIHTKHEWTEEFEKCPKVNTGANT